MPSTILQKPTPAATAARTDQALQRSLLATLAYFDLFDYPLTLLELHQLQYAIDGAPREASMTNVLAALSDLGAQIETRDGLTFLAGRASTVARRLRGYRLAEPKYRKALRAVRWMRLLPTVRMVAVCNSLAMSAAEEASDIDLFMVVRPGYLWITRLLTVGALALAGQRPRGANHADKICLSFFVSERALDLAPLTLPGEDTHLAYWLAAFVPIYDPDGVLPKMFARNAWMHRIIPGARAKRPIALRSVGAPRIQWTMLLPLLHALEPLAKRLQMRKFPAQIARMMNKDTRVVVTDDVLKFHVNDRRAEFNQGFRERLAELDL